MPAKNPALASANNRNLHQGRIGSSAALIQKTAQRANNNNPNMILFGCYDNPGSLQNVQSRIREIQKNSLDAQANSQYWVSVMANENQKTPDALFVDFFSFSSNLWNDPSLTTELNQKTQEAIEKCASRGGKHYYTQPIRSFLTRPLNPDES